MHRWITATALLLLAPIDRANPSDLEPGAGRSISLGGFQGALYYTVEPEGFKVVATLAACAEEPPIGLISTLGSGQRLTISMPRGVGDAAIDLDIARQGDLLVITEPSEDNVSIVNRW